jgi:hypothetical protein
VGQWVKAKPQVQISSDSATTPPIISESRTTLVGIPEFNPDDIKTVPAGGAATPAPQPPTVLPEPVASTQQPEKLPVAPQPAEPKKQPTPTLSVPKPTTTGAISLKSLTAFGGLEGDYFRALQTNRDGYRITMDQAVMLGVINAREFQDRREDVYLAALPVSLERFNLAAHAFYTEQVVRDFIGKNLPSAGRMWDINSTAGVTKQFATGGQLLVQFANQVVLQLGSGRPDVAVSNLSLTFIQPFLQGGGLAVNLESLTATERSLVYAMRSYARFRKLFYVATCAGPFSSGGLTNNPYGLAGLSVNLGRGVGENLTAPILGYLPLLQQAALIANSQRNVIYLERLLKLYQAFREGGQQSDLQVMQVEAQLLNSRGALLGAAGGSSLGSTGIRGYMDALDNFKLQLGLPLMVGLDLDDAPLKPIRQQLTKFEAIYADAQNLETSARQYNPNDPIEQFRAKWRKLLTESDLVKGTKFAKEIVAKWDEWAKMTEQEMLTRVADRRKERTKLLDERADREVKGIVDPKLEEKAARRLGELEYELELAAFEQVVRAHETKPWGKLEGPARNVAQASSFRDVFNAFYQLVLEARNERLDDTRTNWPALAPLPAAGINMLTSTLDEAYTAGVQSALSNRLDLMNARAQVVDSWRQIAVTANALQGVLTVQYTYNAGTFPGGSTPFQLSGNNSSQNLTFNASLPLVRRAERNNYRATLINYQRQRRTLMAFEDNIANDVRNDIRQMRTIAELYKIQQRVVALQYAQVDNAQAILLQPPIPGSTTDAGSAAALTNQLLTAQSGLVTAQNTLYTYWVSYISARMALYLDLELMQLDDRGVWIDEQITGNDTPPRPGPDGQSERLPTPQPVEPPAGK